MCESVREYEYVCVYEYCGRETVCMSVYVCVVCVHECVCVCVCVCVCMCVYDVSV